MKTRAPLILDSASASENNGASPTLSGSFSLAVRDEKTLIPRYGVAVMGILNVTPDSFSDGGHHADTLQAVDVALEMLDAGADIVDVGGESTRPGANPVDEREELRRVIPVIDAVMASRPDAVISVDTRKAAVAEAALNAGAMIVNDVSALRDDPRMAVVCAESGCAVVLMHMRGTPASMQDNPFYDNVSDDIFRFLRERVDFSVDTGIPREKIIVDPGIGFGKTLEHNLTLIAGLKRFHSLTGTVMLGHSRKRFIGGLLGNAPVDQRDEATLAVSLWAALTGGAHILRVHDVGHHVAALKIIQAIETAGRQGRRSC